MFRFCTLSTRYSGEFDHEFSASQSEKTRAHLRRLFSRHRRDFSDDYDSHTRPAKVFNFFDETLFIESVSGKR